MPPVPSSRCMSNQLPERGFYGAGPSCRRPVPRTAPAPSRLLSAPSVVRVTVLSRSDSLRYSLKTPMNKEILPPPERENNHSISASLVDTPRAFERKPKSPIVRPILTSWRSEVEHPCCKNVPRFKELKARQFTQDPLDYCDGSVTTHATQLMHSTSRHVL